MLEKLANVFASLTCVDESSSRSGCWLYTAWVVTSLRRE